MGVAVGRGVAEGVGVGVDVGVGVGFCVGVGLGWCLQKFPVAASTVEVSRIPPTASAKTIIEIKANFCKVIFFNCFPRTSKTYA
jgi:hypothetical protein